MMKNAKTFTIGGCYNSKNMRIKAISQENTPGFDIYLNLFGTQHYLMHHRHNAMIYMLLKNEKSFDELLRWKEKDTLILKRHFGSISKKQISKMSNGVNNLIRAINNYFQEMHQGSDGRKKCYNSC